MDFRFQLQRLLLQTFEIREAPSHRVLVLAPPISGLVQSNTECCQGASACVVCNSALKVSSKSSHRGTVQLDPGLCSLELLMHAEVANVTRLSMQQLLKSTTSILGQAAASGFEVHWSTAAERSAGSDRRSRLPTNNSLGNNEKT